MFCIKYYIWSVWSVTVTQSCPTLGQNTGLGSCSLLQEIFPTQGSNPGLPHCKLMVYHLSHQGSPGILEWVTYPFCSVSSWPRNQIGISCVTDWATSWATREAPQYFIYIYTHTHTHTHTYTKAPNIIYIHTCVYISQSRVSNWTESKVIPHLSREKIFLKFRGLFEIFRDIDDIISSLSIFLTY